MAQLRLRDPQLRRGPLQLHLHAPSFLCLLLCLTPPPSRLCRKIVALSRELSQAKQLKLLPAHQAANRILVLHFLRVATGLRLGQPRRSRFLILSQASHLLPPILSLPLEALDLGAAISALFVKDRRPCFEVREELV